MMQEPCDFPRELSAEMAALSARVLAEDGAQPDATLMPWAEGRALVERANARWNRDLPPLALRETVVVDADPVLGSARRNASTVSRAGKCSPRGVDLRPWRWLLLLQSRHA